MPFPAYVPFKAPKPASIEELNRATGGQSTSVQTFDTAGRAQVIARELPRVWNGSYQGFASGAAVRRASRPPDPCIMCPCALFPSAGAAACACAAAPAAAGA
jgi:hypothetical protein